MVIKLVVNVYGCVLSSIAPQIVKIDLTEKLMTLARL